MELGILPGHTETADHWHWRPGWRLGRRMHTMHLTLFEAPTAGAAIRQMEAVDAVLGPREWGPFHPHVSIAYADGATAIDAAYEGLAADVAPLDPVVIEKPTLTLMRLGRDRRVYEWDVVRELSLGR